MFIVFGVILLLFVVVNILIYSSASYESKKMSGIENPDYILVLGNKLNDDKPSKALLARLEKAVELSEKYPKARIVVSGGLSKGNSKSEAEVMRSYLVEHGIAEDRIITEESSKNTRENMENSKDIIGDGKTVIVVTNSFHMLRSLLIARENKLGTVYGCPVDNGQFSTTFLCFFSEPIFIILNCFASLLD